MKTAILCLLVALLPACAQYEANTTPSQRVVFTCYADGQPTVIIEGEAINMRAKRIDGRVVETWTIVNPGDQGSGHAVFHTAKPDEICGPENKEQL